MIRNKPISISLFTLQLIIYRRSGIIDDKLIGLRSRLQDNYCCKWKLFTCHFQWWEYKLHWIPRSTINIVCVKISTVKIVSCSFTTYTYSRKIEPLFLLWRRKLKLIRVQATNYSGNIGCHQLLEYIIISRVLPDQHTR